MTRPAVPGSSPDPGPDRDPAGLSRTLETKGDCYSAGERRWMETGQHLRGVVLEPVLRLLTRSHVNPDHITLLSLIAGLLFVPCWWWSWYWTGWFLLWIHVCLDGLDGPLARYQNSASPRGSFTDSFCDQLVVTVVTIMLMVRFPGLSIAAGGIFLVAYTAVVALAMVRNSLQIPYSWLVRPRLFVYAAISLELLGVPGAVLTVVWFGNLLLIWKLATGFWKLRGRLQGPGHPQS
jgi:phosphatidylglycerophosphate synthase